MYILTFFYRFFFGPVASKKIFATIGYGDQESTGPRSHPDFQKESQCFRVELRRKDYLNPYKSNPVFESLDRENKLSEAMKSFTSLARACRIDCIKENLQSHWIIE